MKFAKKMVLTTIISMFMTAFASSDVSSISGATGEMNNNKDMDRKIDELKSSFDKISAATMKATRDLAKAGAESMQDSLKTANDSLISLMTTVYELIAPIIKTQTVYKSADGQNYVIPTASISTREKFDIASFKTINDQKLKEKLTAATTSQSHE